MRGRGLPRGIGVCCAMIMTMAAFAAQPSRPASAVAAPPRTASDVAAPRDVQVPRSDGEKVALRVFEPPPHGGCAPLALLSPGAGAGIDPQALAYLAAALQHRGWRAILIEHKDGGHESLRDRIRNGGLRDGLLAMTTDPAAYVSRLADVGAALIWSHQRCQPPFQVLIGHSMGAATVMIEAGARNKMNVNGGNRFDAYVALSPQGPGAIFPAHAWNNIDRPLLVLTGTRDEALEGSWKTRLTPYDDLPRGCHWLGVVDDANHLNFAGFGYGHQKVESAVVPTIVAFLNGARRHACASPAPMSGLTLKTK